MSAQLVTPRTEVLIEQPTSPDFLEYQVQTDNRDVTAYDLARERQKWPRASDAGAFWAEYISWSAMRRSGAFAGDFEAFHKVCVQVRLIDRDGRYVGEKEAPETASPFPGGVGTDS